MAFSLKVRNKIINTPLLEIINDLKSQLHNGKLQTIKVIGQDIRVTCVNPDHKGGHESEASAGVYFGKDSDKLKYGTYHCFTCGIACSFVHFVAMAFECSDDTAEQWLIDNYADATEEYEIDLPEIELVKPKAQYINENILKKFQDFHPYMIQRKLTKEVIKEFEIKYSDGYLIFPVRDHTGKILMLTRRSVEGKTFIIDKDKEKPLYLLNYIKRHNIDKALICEGQIDALTAWGYGMPAMATMGAVSDIQINELNKSGIRVLYLFFDNDKAGREFTYKILRKLNKQILPIIVKLNIPNKKDINDLTDDEFWNCIETAEKSAL